MSYSNLPSQYPGMYELVVTDEGVEKWVAIIAKNKRDKNLCQVAFCKNLSEKGSDSGRSLKCANCRIRLWRANNPIRAIYNSIKNKARRRRIPFTLTFEHFEALCKETGYHRTRGRRAGKMHLDRIDALKGYEDGNVQVLEAVENVVKGRREPTRTRDEWEGGGQEESEDVEYRPIRWSGSAEVPEEDESTPF